MGSSGKFSGNLGKNVNCRFFPRRTSLGRFFGDSEPFFCNGEVQDESMGRVLPPEYPLGKETSGLTPVGAGG